MSSLAQMNLEGQMDAQICKLFPQERVRSGQQTGTDDRGIPMGSSRVENQMTCDGEVSVGRALRTERMALKP